MEKRAQADVRPGARSASRSAEVSGVASTELLRPAAAGAVDEHVIAFHYPRSGLAENFKQIRLVIQNMLPEGDNRVLMFTSAYRGEGKTTAVLNFAAAVALDPSRRAIVVDADLREPRVHSLLGMRMRAGFSDLLVTDAPVESVTVPSPIPGLAVILSGELPPNPGELFGNERTRQVFAELKQKYDCVVVDTPPVLPVADTIHMAPFADGVVLIVEAARTSRKRIQRAIQLLNNANASVMGFLLNKGQVALSDHAAVQYDHDGR